VGEKEVFFFVSFVLQAREAAKSGLVLFHEVIEYLDREEPEESFNLFERAAAKGHEESIWITSVVKVEMKKKAWKEAFAKTEEPLGCWFAGKLSDGREEFDFFKKSAEGGCSWGQVEYGWSFKYGSLYAEKDKKWYVEWLEKAARQNNPEAMHWLGEWFRYEGEENDKEKAMSYHRAAAELGWKRPMHFLACMLRKGEGCAKDLRQAVIWGAKGGLYEFWKLLGDAKGALESRATEELDCDFNQLCYLLGWGLYWYQYGTWGWNDQSDEVKDSGELCLDYYCSCVELQRTSVFTFLLCWNQTTGVKGPGQMIAQMVWEKREDNLVEAFEESGGKEPETKRIKK
jgi:TPR repeat protein